MSLMKFNQRNIYMTELRQLIYLSHLVWFSSGELLHFLLLLRRAYDEVAASISQGRDIEVDCW